MDTVIKQRLEYFFNKEIDPKNFAQTLRRFAMETIKMYIHHEECNGYVDKDRIAEGHYFLHFLCEILDPCLEEPLATEEK